MGAESSRCDAEAIWRQRDKYLNMTLLERRNQYPGNFVAKDTVKTWPEYFIDDIQTTERHSYGLYVPREDINQKVALWEGDITQMEIDSIVNSAARPERGGGGQVNTAVLSQAGEYYRQECLLNGLGSPGDAMVTGGYRLPAKYIINTLAPRDQDRNVLRLCYSNCLDTAKNLNFRTIAFPCIATKKRNGFPTDVATNLALDTVRKWLEMFHKEIDMVIFCVYDARSIATYRRYMQKYFPIRGYCATPSTYQPQADDYEEEQEENEAENAQEEPSSTNKEGDSLSLEDWRDMTCQPGVHEITIQRGDPQKLVKQLHAIYSDTTDIYKETRITFEGEEGLDTGALTKEFFYEAIETLAHTLISNAPLFEGAVDHTLPCPSRVHVGLNSFTIAGRILAHSILNYGMGFCGLSPAIVYILSHDVAYDDIDSAGIPFSADDIVDVDLRKLLEVTSADELTTDDKASLRDYMERCNVGYLRIESGTLDFIKQELILYEVVYRRWTQIEALRQGLETFKLYSFLCSNPTADNVREVFPSSKDLKIEPHMIHTKLEFYGTKDQTYEWFKKIIKDINEAKLADVSLSTLLLFWTGEPRLPTSFLAFEVDPDMKLPQASTCFNRLFVPGGCESYEVFCNSFSTALTLGAKGFGEM